MQGFIPTPVSGRPTADNDHLYVAMEKPGSRNGRPAPPPGTPARPGTVNKIALPSRKPSKFTPGSRGRRAEMPRAWRSPAPPRRFRSQTHWEPVHLADRLRQHCDQVFGDLLQVAALSLWSSRLVTHDHHARVERTSFSDKFIAIKPSGGRTFLGHRRQRDRSSRKSFGGFARSYTFGDDALSTLSSHLGQPPACSFAPWRDGLRPFPRAPHG